MGLEKNQSVDYNIRIACIITTAAIITITTINRPNAASVISGDVEHGVESVDDWITETELLSKSVM